MQKELIHSASTLFPTFEHWQSFLYLSDNKDAIVESWFMEATNKIRRYFKETLPPEWDCEPWGNRDRDTRWFLRSFGPDSLTVSFAWWYRLDLRLDPPSRQKYNKNAVSRLLKEIEYRPIQLAFDRIDRQFDLDSELIEIGNFRFGTAHDGSFQPRDLAWHAAHHTSAFVDQAIAKIERFTKSEKVTYLLTKINQTAFDEAKAAKS